MNKSVDRNILAVADHQDPSFRLDAEKFLSVFPFGFSTEIFPSSVVDSGSESSVTGKLEQGVNLVSYFGHGSVNMWGKDKLFTVTDVEKLTSPIIPVVFQMTCLTGLFTHPTATSLTEALLFQPDSGAVSVIAPTSLTLPFNQTSFSQSFAEAYVANDMSRLGDVLLYTQNHVAQEGERSRDVLLTFLLFGDPASIIHK